jgi:hypothetical protein
MELGKKIQRAQAIIRSFDGTRRARLLAICLEIQRAQAALNQAAEPFFEVCIEQCKGLCCRNICINEVITQLDLIYILTLHKEIVGQMEKCARAETLFSADCLFLQNRKGPCIFGPDAKPERCIITFCQDTRPIKAQIKTVRSKFSKLSRYTLFQRPFLGIRLPQRFKSRRASASRRQG